MSTTPREFDLAFVLRDTNGNIEAAQRRIDRAFDIERKRAEGLVEALELVQDLTGITKSKDLLRINKVVSESLALYREGGRG